MKKLLVLSLCSIGVWACSNAKSTESTASTEVQEAQVEKPAVKTLPQTELDSMMKKDSVIVIDVRTPGEVAQGFIPGADSFIDINGADFNAKIGQLDKGYTYVMYCRSGGRSGRASTYMVQNGFTKVYNLQGGVLAYKGVLAKP